MIYLWDKDGWKPYEITEPDHHKKIGNIYADASFLVEGGGDACGNKEETQ